MDSKTQFSGRNYNPMMCGEESFGTGSNHVREKDGLWAVLAWLSVLAHYNRDPAKKFVHVEDIVMKHWKAYGRNYYCRYDYEGVASTAANSVMDNMRTQFSSLTGSQHGSFTVKCADEFTYSDPIDGSVSENQGIRVLMEDGSRIVLRLSGTAGSGATIRLYLEKYEPGNGKITLLAADALGELVKIALNITKIPELTGMERPTVIT